MESRVLLDVRELFEPAVTVRTFVGLLSGVDSNMLHQLMVGAERLETLLTLVRLHLRPVGVSVVHLHRGLVHENLREEAKKFC